VAALPSRAHFLILAVIFLLTFCPNAFAQDENGEQGEQVEQTERDKPIKQTEQDWKKFAVGLGPEWNMVSRNYFAGGASLSFDYNLFRSFAAGVSLTASSNFSVFTALEPAAMFRWYFWGKNHTGFFAQTDVGAFLYMEDGHTQPMFLGGLRAGYRLPLGTFYIEPYGRGGYPFAFGIGVTAGMSFPTKKKPEPADDDFDEIMRSLKR